MLITTTLSHNLKKIVRVEKIRNSLAHSAHARHAATGQRNDGQRGNAKSFNIFLSHVPIHLL